MSMRFLRVAIYSFIVMNAVPAVVLYIEAGGWTRGLQHVEQEFLGFYSHLDASIIPLFLLYLVIVFIGMLIAHALSGTRSGAPMNKNNLRKGIIMVILGLFMFSDFSGGYRGLGAGFEILIFWPLGILLIIVGLLYPFLGRGNKKVDEITPPTQ